MADLRVTRHRRNEPAAPTTPRSDDELLAFLLTLTWSLLTGRTLRDAAPEDLMAEELIEFWADDFPDCGDRTGPSGAGSGNTGPGQTGPGQTGPGRRERPAAGGR
jgi:hypothetical protein